MNNLGWPDPWNKNENHSLHCQKISHSPHTLVQTVYQDSFDVVWISSKILTIVIFYTLHNMLVLKMLSIQNDDFLEKKRQVNCNASKAGCPWYHLHVCFYLDYSQQGWGCFYINKNKKYFRIASPGRENCQGVLGSNLHSVLNIFNPFSFHIICFRKHLIRATACFRWIAIHRPAMNKLNKDFCEFFPREWTQIQQEIFTFPLPELVTDSVAS